MDSRDVKESVPEVEYGHYLEKIYDLQKELLEGYISIEGLPQYPIDVNTKKSQILLKDFTARVIEELSEGYESMELVIDLMEKNGNFLMGNYSEEDFLLAINHLQNVSEEMSDSIHFMIELLIYANVLPEDIDRYVNKSGLFNGELPLKGDIISKCMVIGGAWLRQIATLTDFHTLDILDQYNTELPEDEAVDPCLHSVAHIYNKQLYLEYQKCLWQVTHHLNIARNCFKNKPWKQSQMMTNEIAYQEELVKSFIYLMGTLYQMGLDSKGVFYIYFKKNIINKFRQRSKY